MLAKIVAFFSIVLIGGLKISPYVNKFLSIHDLAKKGDVSAIALTSLPYILMGGVGGVPFINDIKDGLSYLFSMGSHNKKLTLRKYEEEMKNMLGEKSYNAIFKGIPPFIFGLDESGSMSTNLPQLSNVGKYIWDQAKGVVDDVAEGKYLSAIGRGVLPEPVKKLGRYIPSTTTGVQNKHGATYTGNDHRPVILSKIQGLMFSLGFKPNKVSKLYEQLTDRSLIYDVRKKVINKAKQELGSDPTPDKYKKAFSYIRDYNKALKELIKSGVKVKKGMFLSDVKPNIRR